MRGDEREERESAIQEMANPTGLRDEWSGDGPCLEVAVKAVKAWALEAMAALMTMRNMVLVVVALGL